MSKIYVVGPMRGIPGYNAPAFNAAALRLIEEGHKVRTPPEQDVAAGVPLKVFDPTRKDIDWNAYPPRFNATACRKRNFACVEWADELLALRGWDRSLGAWSEVTHAWLRQIPVRDETGRPIEWKHARARWTLATFCAEAATYKEGGKA